MSSVEVWVLFPLLLLIIILNAVVADTFRDALKEAQMLRAELERHQVNATGIANGSVPP